jgi:hypothetical protein
LIHNGINLCRDSHCRIHAYLEKDVYQDISSLGITDIRDPTKNTPPGKTGQPTQQRLISAIPETGCLKSSIAIEFVNKKSQPQVAGH